MSDVILMAHRGLRTLAPENTLAAFEAAVERGIDWVEFDVNVLADGTLVVIHDPTWDRTTSKSGWCADTDVAKLATIDAGSWFRADYRGERVPTLRDTIQFMNAYRLNANIEIKTHRHNLRTSTLMVASLIEAMAALDADLEVIVSSFNHPILYALKQKAPDVPVGCLYTTAGLQADWYTTMHLVGADYLHVQDSWVTHANVDLVHDAGFKLNVWTVNDRVRANQLANWGVDGIISDVADQFKFVNPDRYDPVE